MFWLDSIMYKKFKIAFLLISLVAIGSYPQALADNVDLESLARQPLTTESFKEILRLCETGNAKAIPVLEKILSDNIDSTIIHGFAAAQALFCIDTDQSHKILSRYLLSERYNAIQGYRYTFHWDMDKIKRNKFIDMYHLRNLSDTLAVQLKAKEYMDKTGRYIDFNIKLQNISQKTLRIRDRNIYPGMMLYFRSKSRTYSRSFETSRRKARGPTWLELKPGQIKQYDITVFIRSIEGKLKPSHWGISENAKIWAETQDVAYDILNEGEFEIVAMYEERPLTAFQIERSGVKDSWSGRAVSKPVNIKITSTKQ